MKDLGLNSKMSLKEMLNVVFDSGVIDPTTEKRTMTFAGKPINNLNSETIKKKSYGKQGTSGSSE